MPVTSPCNFSKVVFIFSLRNIHSLSGPVFSQIFLKNMRLVQEKLDDKKSDVLIGPFMYALEECVCVYSLCSPSSRGGQQTRTFYIGMIANPSSGGICGGADGRWLLV